jgi:Nuclease-related domain
MLIKDRDGRNGTIEELRDLLALNLSPRKKFLIERELRNISPVDDGGRDAVRFINFYCADSRNWAIIHDLKIENNGSSTQIDHILINQFFDIYLVESKNYTYSLKITAAGEFLVFDGRKYQSVDSPIEENRKRIQALRKALAENKIMPKRLGIPVRPRIKPYVLVSPAANVLRPPKSVYDTSSIVSADYLIQTLLKKVEGAKRFCQKLKRLPKVFNTNALQKAAAQLASLNAPCTIDYGRLFCPEETSQTPTGSLSDGDVPVYCDFAI